MGPIGKTNEPNIHKIEMDGSQPAYSIQEYIQILNDNSKQLEERVIKLEMEINNLKAKIKRNNTWYHE